MADDNEFWNKVDKHIADLEQRLGLPTNFLTEIADETPWSFIIKAHTLIEAAVGHVITNALGDTVLDQWATSLPLRGRHSKVSLLGQLTDIRKNDIQFIEALSEIRNQLVHRIENVGFEYAAYFADLSEAKRQSLFKRLSLMQRDADEVDLDPIAEYPQQAILENLKALLTILHLVANNLELKQESVGVKLEYATLMRGKKALNKEIEEKGK